MITTLKTRKHPVRGAATYAIIRQNWTAERLGQSHPMPNSKQPTWGDSALPHNNRTPPDLHQGQRADDNVGGLLLLGCDACASFGNRIISSVSHLTLVVKDESVLSPISLNLVRCTSFTFMLFWICFNWASMCCILRSISSFNMRSRSTCTMSNALFTQIPVMIFSKERIITEM